MNSGDRVGRKRVNDIANEASIGRMVKATNPMSQGEIQSKPVSASRRCRLMRRPAGWLTAGRESAVTGPPRRLGRGAWLRSGGGSSTARSVVRLGAPGPERRHHLAGHVVDLDLPQVGRPTERQRVGDQAVVERLEPLPL